MIFEFVRHCIAPSLKDPRAARAIFAPVRSA
jgi:hypothetical protein